MSDFALSSADVGCWLK